MATIYRSATPDLELLDIDLVSYIHSNPLNTPLDRPMYIDALSGKGYTLKDVYQRTRSLAHGLRELLGVRPHDVVAFISPNTIDYAVVCHAVIGCGAAVSPTSAALTVTELHAQLDTSQARYLIAHSSLIQTARKAAKGTAVQTIIQADGESAVDGNPTAHMLAISCPASDLISISPSEAEDRIAFICFSSGTSGPAKGVMISHKNVTSNIQQWQKHLTEDNTDRHLNSVAFLPFNHIYGMNIYICTGVVRGFTIVVLPRFDLEVYLRSIQKYRPEDLELVPPVALLLVKSPLVAKYDLSSVRKMFSAAAPLTAELATAVEAMFKHNYGTTVYCAQAWGLTESSPLAAATPPDRMEKRFTVGSIVPNMEYRVVDPETMQDAKTAADGTTELAEIWIRGPNVTKGYYRNVEATRSSFHVDADGKRWFRTGDIGTIDGDGFITIRDRIKEMIKYKGLQVIPSELEGKLLEHEAIEDAAVVGQWVDEQATELPVGFVVVRAEVRSKMKKDGNEEKKVMEGIHRWLNERVANHKRLRGGIRLVDGIPKSPSGKILRKELRESLKKERSAKL
jgi:acyl-CoA synthetase (AMP-forming)/AMP-acid ligase II